MRGLDPTIKAQIQAVLQKCPPLEGDSTLRAIFIDTRLHPWQARVPQATNTADRVDGAMAFLWQQYHAAFMANGLVLFLQVLADQFDPNDKLHIDLHDLATQLAVTIEPPRIINLPISQTTALADCPYRSLFAFRPEHAPIFFGRESFTQQLVTTMQRQPFTALLGASGSGKSSVVMAGLVPALNGTQDKWLFSHFRPADNPFLGLANALVPLLEPAMSSIKQLGEAADLAVDLRQGKYPLRNVLQRIQDMRPDHRLLLIADQFEELYTTAKAEREPFMDLLIAAVQNPAPNVKLVTTMRADFLEQASRYRPFADTLQHQTILLGPMTRDEMSLAIEQPALMQGVSFEPHLLGRILDDVGKAEGNLPLLEFALSELWQLQDKAMLTHTAYEQIGQVKGALSRHADKVFAERLSAAEQGQARRIFVNLVTPGQGAEDTRRVAPQADLAEDWPLVTKLATERLVVTNEHEKIQTAEVVHEALIRHWGQLREWLTADREFLVWRQRLRDDLKQWLDTNRDDGALLRGAPLALAQEWLSQRAAELNEAEKDFIEVSQTAQARRQRQQRLGMGALISFLLVVIAVMFYLNNQVNSALGEAQIQTILAVRAKGTAESERIISLSSQLATFSKFPNTRADTALLLATTANKITDTFVSRDALLTNLLAHPRLTRLWNTQHTADTIAFSPNGKLLAVGSIDGTVTLWDTETSQPTMPSIKINYDISQKILFNSNGKILVTYSDGTIKFWDVNNGLQISQPFTYSGSLYGMDFSPDGNILASVSSQDGVILWEVKTGQRLYLSEQLNKTSSAEEVVFSPDGKFLAFIVGMEVMFYNITNHQIMADRSIDTEKFIEGSYGSQKLAISPNGDILAISKFDTILLWDIQQNQPFGTLLKGHNDWISDIAFSPNGQILASVGADTNVILWDVYNNQPIGQPLTSHFAAVNSVAFSPDGKFLASGSDDKTIIFWDLQNDKPFGKEFRFNNDWAGQTIVSPDSKTLAFIEDGDIILWDIQKEKEIGLPLKGPATSIAFSPSEELLASSIGSDIILWNINTHQPIGNPFTYHSDTVNSIVFSNDGQTLASKSNNNTIIFWNMQNSSVLGIINAPDGFSWRQGQNDLAFSPNGKFLASGSENNVILWSTQDYHQVKLFVGHKQEVSSLAFSPDSKIIASGSRDSTIILWDIESGQLIKRLEGQGRDVTSIAFSRDGNILASGSGGSKAVRDIGAVMLWDVQSGQALGTPLDSNPESVDKIVFSPNGKYLVSTHERSFVLWDMEFASWQTHACYIANRNLTQAEWQQYLGNEPYRKTCDNLPAGE